MMLTTQSRPRIAYLTMAFPERSETGVIREMHVLDQEWFDVHVFSTRPLSFHGIYEPKANAFKSRAAGFSTKATLAGALATAKRLIHGERGFLYALKTTLQRSGPLLPKTLPMLLLATGMAVQAEALGISYLHANFASLQGFAAWVVHQLTGIPYGFTMHAYDLFEQGFMMEEKVRDAAVVVSISQYNVCYIQERWGIAPDGIHLIHCGVDLSEFTPVVHARGVPLRLFSVGRLHPMKGFPYLLDAIALLRDEIPLRLDIVGAGDEHDHLEAQIRRHGLQGRVALRTGVPQDELKELYRRADVYVQPSIQLPNGAMEGVPGALMEAMAVALPCISTRLSGIPELVEEGKTGLLVAPEDPRQLADAIRWMHTHPEEALQMGRRGRQKVEAEFDASENARQLGRIIATAIQARAPRRIGNVHEDVRVVPAPFTRSQK
jgi:glycosyltransferase involved in cell wall biosynthesis